MEVVTGRGLLTSANTAVVGERTLPFEVAVIATGFAAVGTGVGRSRRSGSSTRHAYHLPEVPEHLIVIGSGVTGVSSCTCLPVSVHSDPYREPTAGAAASRSGGGGGARRGLHGARGHVAQGIGANGATRTADGVVVTTEDGRRVTGGHVLLAVGFPIEHRGLGLETVGIATSGGHITVDSTNVPRCSIFTPPGRHRSATARIGCDAGKEDRTARPRSAGEAARLHQGGAGNLHRAEIASVGLEEADARAEDAKVRITKVPFAANPRALIQGNPTGFAKVISDPATHVVLGGTIVGHHASELIGILALAAQGRMRVDVLVDTLMAHPPSPKASQMRLLEQSPVASDLQSPARTGDWIQLLETDWGLEKKKTTGD